MNMKKLLATILLFSAPSALALDNITRPYTSPRSTGMGGVKLTTGLYDENFFGNPARVTANPVWRFQLLEVVAEASKDTFSTASELAGGDDPLVNAASTAGNVNHGRVQTTFPAIYLPNLGGGKMSYAIGIISSTQFDFALRRSYRVDPAVVTDVGPAVTVGRKFLEDDKLSVGVTPHLTYRLATKSGFTFVDILKGNSISPLESGGEGAHLDVDLGGTYILPWKPLELDLMAALAVNNVLGGGYDTLSVELAKTGLLPPAQPRSIGFGVSARKAELWKFTEALVALELHDIGNNADGSMFRLFHIGGEAHWKIIALRAGLYQGYLTAGLGLNFWLLRMDFSTYGEEMSLNVGGQQNRIFAFKLGLQI
jgi:hypothetical protein